MTNFDAQCYELAFAILDRHPHLQTAERCASLASLIHSTTEKFVFDADAERDPTPYCSYGHPTKASCDCGPIAENE